MKTNKQFLPDMEQALTLAPVPENQHATASASADAVRAAPIYAEVAVTIRRPRHDVAAVMFNPRYDAAWIGAVRKTQRAAPGPLRNGARVAREWRWLGYRGVETCEVVEHVPDRCMEMTTRLPFGLRIRYELEGIPEGAIARVRIHGQAAGLLRVMAMALNPLLRSTVIHDLDRLKALLESGVWRSLAA